MKTRYIISIVLAASVLSSQAQTYTLEQCKQMALEHNQAMRTANSLVLQAQEQKKEAFTKYFPKVSIDGMGFKATDDILQYRLDIADRLPAGLISQIPPQYATMIPQSIKFSAIDGAALASVMAVQPVFAGGQIVNGNKMAQLGVEKNEIVKELSVNDVNLTTEQYYWQVVTLQEKQKTLKEVASMLQSIEKDAKVAVDAGVKLKNDLLQVQLKQTDVENNQVKLDNALSLCKMLLAQYMGLANTNFNVVNDVNPNAIPAFPMDLRQNHDETVKVIPEYRLLQKNVEKKVLETKLERGKLLPTVGVGVGYNVNRFEGANTTGNFGAVFATVSVPLSDWWGGSHAVKRRKLAEEDARQQLDDKAQLLEIKMQNNWNNVQDTYKQLVLMKKAIAQSEENLRLNRNFYKAGTTTMTNLLDAQQQYQKAHDDFVDTFSQFHTAILKYKQSTGQN